MGLKDKEIIIIDNSAGFHFSCPEEFKKDFMRVLAERPEWPTPTAFFRAMMGKLIKEKQERDAHA